MHRRSRGASLHETPWGTSSWSCNNGRTGAGNQAAREETGRPRDRSRRAGSRRLVPARTPCPNSFPSSGSWVRAPSPAPPEPSLARTRGRSTGTRQPPRVTSPCSWPWRTAPRLESWRPSSPTTSVTSSSISSASTPSPTPTEKGHEALSGDAHQLPEGLLHPCREPALHPRDGLLGRYGVLHGGSSFNLGRSPRTLPAAADGAGGPPPSSSTGYGTASRLTVAAGCGDAVRQDGAEVSTPKDKSR